MTHAALVATVGHCPKCGDELRLGLPMDMSVFIDATRSFVKAHEKRCGAITMCGERQAAKGKAVKHRHKADCRKRSFLNDGPCTCGADPILAAGSEKK